MVLGRFPYRPRKGRRFALFFLTLKSAEACSQGEACRQAIANVHQRYLALLPPAIAGQHGDVHTFRVCCRLVRRLVLSDHEALTLLTDWNARCEPPWAERDLIDKLARAHRYGREPIGGLLDRR